jgi:tetratricopeptide (TPR) repeat protein
MPDISSASPQVQSQLRDAYAALQQKLSGAAEPAESRAAAYGDMGRLFFATEYFDAAEACFVNAQSLDPGDLRWPYLLAHVHRRRNEPAQAAAAFERVLTLDPNYVPALVWLGDMRLVEGRADAAEAPLAKALTLAPGEAAALDRAGRAALARRDYPTAVKQLSAALQLRPEASSLHYPLSLAYRGLGDTRNAEAHLRLRGDVDVAPSDPEMQQVGGLLQNASAAEVRGSAAMARRQWAEAVASFRQAVALAPDHPFTHLNLGTSLYQMGDAAGALAEFETAVRLMPGLAKAQYGIGIVQEAAGRDAEAVAAFKKAVDDEPTLVEAHMSLADALRRTGRDTEALPHYSVVIARSPAVSQAYFGYAIALVHIGRYKDARERLEQAARTFPDQPGLTHALARVLAAAPDDAVRDGPRALSLVETLLKTQRTVQLALTMAMALAENGRFEEAVQWQRNAMSAASQSGQSDVNGELARNLSRYERKQPCRTPWPEDDPIFRPRPAR